MVNTEEFTKRLHKIMEYHDLNAASFADKIDVGRSSISHLLSGRNKPSLDFVMKIVKAFPEVEMYWLLNGKGEFPKKASSASAEKTMPRPAPSMQQDLFQVQLPQVEKTPPAPQKGKKIQKIVFFYTDGSFEAWEN